MKRYDCDDSHAMREDPAGEWVSFDDAQACLAEVKAEFDKAIALLDQWKGLGAEMDDKYKALERRVDELGKYVLGVLGGVALVHRLRYGAAVCGFGCGVVPAEWPVGHLWSNDEREITCIPCKGGGANG